jgi:hypothetical protein
MHRKIIAFAAFLVLAAPSGLTARELADAPEVTLLGFSPDGRYFAFEQYEADSVSDAAVAAIDVIDRQTNRSVEGFPFGFLGMSKKDEEFPLRVGGHEIKAKEELDVPARLEALRAEVRGQAKTRLDALGIGQKQGRRLAGQPITDRTPGKSAPEFVLSPTLPGPVPDLQYVYRVSTEILPKDYQACLGGAKTGDHRIVVKLDALQNGRRGKRGKPQASTKIEVPWAAGDAECAASVQITDVIDAPAIPNASQSYVVVVMLATSWSGHAETARYLAAFVPVPK